MYKVEFTTNAVKNLNIIDKQTRVIIYSWIMKNLESCSISNLQGKALRGSNVRKWCYRIGNYRLLADIQDDKGVILVLNIGHRQEMN